jgi:hypothetical protein
MTYESENLSFPVDTQWACFLQKDKDLSPQKNY